MYLDMYLSPQLMHVVESTFELYYWHCPHVMLSKVYVTVRYLSFCLSYSPAAAASGGFAAVGPAGRTYRSIAARPAPQQRMRSVLT